MGEVGKLWESVVGGPGQILWLSGKTSWRKRHCGRLEDEMGLVQARKCGKKVKSEGTGA